MRVLALDSTTRAGSVAIVDNDHVVLERSGDDGRPHAERLPAEILDALADAGLALADIDLFAIASGPGSFTGLRIGIATIQGLAFVRHAQVAAIPALEVLAQIGSREVARGATIGVWMDAYRHEVFSALYRVTGTDLFSHTRLSASENPSVGAPEETLDRWTQSGCAPAVVIGDGAVRYSTIASHHRVRMVPAPPLAGAIGLMAVDRARMGQTVDPSGVQPLYIRRPDAEVARERAARADNHPEQRPGQPRP
jgi:tRNA threonylcarbamoyladenosine biosynthesis protein TsaB